MRRLLVVAIVAAGLAHGQFVKQYCAGCHGEQAKAGGLVLTRLDAGRPGENAAEWEKVVVKLRTGLMPPAGARRPDPADLHRFVSSLEAGLDRASAAKPNPGRPALHRLNRVEYANSVRDLLALDVDV